MKRGSKYIFLDVDGVLNGASTESRTPSGFVGVDQTMIGRLADLVRKSRAKIVLSSSWRQCWFHGIPDPDGRYLKKELARQKLTIEGRTPGEDAGSWHRGREILLFLKDHPHSSWVILDDEPFDFREEGLEPHVVRTNWRVGLTDEDTKKALEILTADLPDIAPQPALAEMSDAEAAFAGMSTLQSGESEAASSEAADAREAAISEAAAAREAAAQKAAEESHHGRKL